jgi:tetratricopeptide (TPR) repeat protein
VSSRSEYDPKTLSASPGLNVDIPTLLNQDLSFHQVGRLADAETVYQQILKTSPSHFDALHLLGIIHYQRGNYEDAIHQIDLALETNPKTLL